MIGMRRILPLLLLLGTISCSWMSSDTASVFANKEVLTADEAKGYLNGALMQNATTCSTLNKPALYLIDYGYDRILSRPFYYKDSLDTCYVALLLTPCPANELSDTEAGNYYKGILNFCNPTPYEL